VSVSHAHDGLGCLLDSLGRLLDPRRPRGVRHPLVAVLGVLVIATLAGAANYRQMGSVAADLPQCLLNRLGVRWNLRCRRRVAPSSGTLRRMLIALDADTLDAVVGEWLREHGDCDQAGWRIAVDGKDLRGGWSDEGRLVLFSAFTHRTPSRTGVTIAQIAVPEDTTETTQVNALFAQTDITGALVTADAAHTCAETATFLVEDKEADYLLTIKGNRPTLHSAATTVGKSLIAGPPQHVAEERGHGRISRWSVWSTTLTAEHRIGFPHARRLAVIRRDTADLAGQPLTKEIALAVTSRATLTAAGFCEGVRGHWSVENLSHRHRDTTWREDDHQAHVGNGPRTAATFRNLALGLLALAGITKVKETIESIGRSPQRALDLITHSHRQAATS
jgi:predicted transposase YbfD/YdcC